MRYWAILLLVTILSSCVAPPKKRDYLAEYQAEQTQKKRLLIQKYLPSIKQAVGKKVFLNRTNFIFNCSAFRGSEQFVSSDDTARDRARKDIPHLNVDDLPKNFAPLTVVDILISYIHESSSTASVELKFKLLSGSTEFVFSGNTTLPTDVSKISTDSILFGGKTRMFGSIECLIPFDPKVRFKFSPSEWEKIESQKVWRGMSEDALVLSQGKPIKINYTVVENLTSSQWVMTGDKYFYFENGKLSSWQY